MREKIPYFRSYYEPPDPPEIPECPVCGSDCYEEVYRDCNDEVCGCSDCVRAVSLEDYLAELEEELEDARYAVEEERGSW